MKLCRIVTVPFVLKYHLRNQVEEIVKQRHSVFLVSSPSPELQSIAKECGAEAHPIAIAREISPFGDLKALVLLYFYFRRQHFDVVHSITPKAGLLTALAGFFAGVPIRLHTFTGQPWMNLKSPVRWIAKLSDRIIVSFNTRCYADSISQRDYLIKEKIGSKEQIFVLGNGSLAGVNFDKFNPGKWKPHRKEIRKELQIPDFSQVINFTGRINKDKGICELIEAFETLIRDRRDVYLLLVGPFETKREPVPADIVQRIRENPKICLLGDTPTPEKYFSVSDLMCLPSYREGFGIVILEAAAMAIPSVATRTVGIIDSIVDGKTGILVPVGDSYSLTEALRRLLDDDLLRTDMGREARKHAEQFDKGFVNTLVLKEYETLMNFSQKRMRAD